jgi:hypothetical protein
MSRVAKGSEHWHDRCIASDPACSYEANRNLEQKSDDVNWLEIVILHRLLD